MRLPFSSPIRTDGTQVPLTGRSDRRSRTAEITHPETKYPVDHSTNRVDPHENAPAFRQAVCDLVAGLAARGAFDEDNLDALNNTINSWLQTWVSSVLTTATRRREVAEQLLAQHVQFVEEVTLELDTLQGERIEITAARDELLRQMSFPTGMLQTERPVVQARTLPESRIRALRTTPTEAEGPDEDDGPTTAVPVPITGPTRPTPLPAVGFSASAEASQH